MITIILEMDNGLHALGWLALIVNREEVFIKLDIACWGKLRFLCIYCSIYLLNSPFSFRHHNQVRPPTAPPFRSGPGNSASAYFDADPSGPPGGGHQGRDWNRSSGTNYPPPDNYSGGRGNYGDGGRGGRGGNNRSHPYGQSAPPYRGGGRGGYGDNSGGQQPHQRERRYADIGQTGPPAAGNYRGGGGGGRGNYGPPNQGGFRHQGPPHDPRNQGQPRYPPPRVSILK